MQALLHFYRSHCYSITWASALVVVQMMISRLTLFTPAFLLLWWPIFGLQTSNDYAFSHWKLVAVSLLMAMVSLFAQVICLFALGELVYQVVCERRRLAVRQALVIAGTVAPACILLVWRYSVLFIIFRSFE